jgi:hypothetical protein
MTIRYALSLSSVTLLLTSGVALMGQVTTGSLNGHVTDTSGKPVSGARVSLESPALFQQRVYTTNERGEYRAQLLPVGVYIVRVSATDLLGKTANDVRVSLGANLSLDFSLKPIKESATAVVEVSANNTQESKTDDKVSVNYSAEELLKLPTGRSFDGALAISPGVTGTGLNASIRGGSMGGQSKSGGGYGQVLYRIDGIDVKDDTGTQWDSPARAQLYEPLPDSIEDVQVVLSALNARNGRTQGGQVNVVTKTGSNTFAGTVRTYINRPSWTTNLPHGPVAGSDISAIESAATETYSRYTDLTLSGPIVKDRVWFYVGTRLQPVQGGTAKLGWLGVPVDPATGDQVPGMTMTDVMKYPLTTYGRYPNIDNVLMNGAPPGFTANHLTNSQWNTTVPANTNYQKFEGKLTAQLSTDHQAYMTFLHDQTKQGGVTGERTSPPLFAVDQAFVGDLTTKTNGYTLGWNGTLASNWFIEARAFKTEVKIGDVNGPMDKPIFVQAFASTGVDASGNPLYLLRETDGNGQSSPSGLSAYYGPTYNLRSSSDITPNVRSNRSANFNIKTFQDVAGQHEIDFGAEYYESKHQFGRERSGGRGVFVGGSIYNPTTKQYLYPTFYTSDDSPLVPVDANGNADPVQVQGSELPMRGPGAHMERYFAGQSPAKNVSHGAWVNDIWSFSDRLNVMGGLRFNRFQINDTNQKNLADVKVWEPRLQVKWNPDGQNKELYTFTAAKLASAYSDEMAAWFRTNGWTTRTVSSWRGPKDQVAVDSMAGGNPAAVNWVTYDELTKVENYGPPSTIVDLSQTSKTAGLQVPYAVELTLGYTRNFQDGSSARINLVQRTYKKEWMVFIHNGYFDPANPTKYLTLVQDPSHLGPAQWQQTHNFTNSDLEQVYRGVELSWKENLTSRLSLGGNYTWSQQTGQNAMDYYNYRDEKLKQGIPESVFAPDGVLARAQVMNVFLMYIVPVGKGNVSASILGNYTTSAVRSLYGVSDFKNQGTPPATINGYSVQPYDAIAGQNVALNYNAFVGGMGAYKGGSDQYHLDVKLQAEFPIYGKLTFTTYLQVSNLFNHILKTNAYDWGSSGELSTGGAVGNSQPINGRPQGSFAYPWGYAGDNTYYMAGRTFTQFSAGLKF